MILIGNVLYLSILILLITNDYFRSSYRSDLWKYVVFLPTRIVCPVLMIPDESNPLMYPKRLRQIFKRNVVYRVRCKRIIINTQMSGISTWM